MAESRAVIEHQKIVIVGGGICGLASALALHRKGIESVVFEKSDTLRATGAAIIIQPNGWRALEQLGVATKLGHRVIPVYRTQFIDLESGECKEMYQGVGPSRCLRRAELLKALAEELPPKTIQLGCKIQSIAIDPFSSYPKILQDDGSILQAKVLIGCDGVNSVVGDFLGMRSRRFFSTCVIRGVTKVLAPYRFHDKFVVMKKGCIQLGRMPMDENHLYWFVTRPRTSQDTVISADSKLIKQSTIESLFGFPEEEVDLVKSSYLDHLFLTSLCYRAPWDLHATYKLRRGTVVLAGDAMHAMGPFIAQGGSASLEDAVVFARCFAKRTYEINPISREWKMFAQIAIDDYVGERKKRVMGLSMQAFLIGTMIDDSSWWLVKFMCGVLMGILFRDSHGHTQYDCGQL